MMYGERGFGVRASSTVKQAPGGYAGCTCAVMHDLYWFCAGDNLSARTSSGERKSSSCLRQRWVIARCWECDVELQLSYMKILLFFSDKGRISEYLKGEIHFKIKYEYFDTWL